MTSNVLREVIDISRKYKEIKEIILFGSRARDDFKISSDIDLAIFTGSDEFNNKMNFRCDIGDINTLYKFDLVFVNERTDKLLLENINREGCVIMKKANKRENYLKALKRLQLAIEKCKDTDDELLLDGLIQRFEFTTELAWKACKEQLIEMGCVEVNGPRNVMREALSYGLIEDELTWRYILEDRNATSHVYDNDVAREISDKIIHQYLQSFLDLAQKF